MSSALWGCCQWRWTELPGQQKRSLYFSSVLASLSPGVKMTIDRQADKHKELLVETLTKQSSSACQLPTALLKPSLTVCVLFTTSHVL